MAYTVERTILEARQNIARLKNIIELGKVAVESGSELKFKAACVAADKMYDSFQVMNKQTLLDDSANEQLESLFGMSIELDNLYYEIKGLQSSIFGSISKKASSDNLSKSESTPSLPEASHTSTSIKLPKISLKNFDGTLKEWPGYFDLYNTLIHNNQSLSAIEKFQYLLSTLKGEPLNLVKHLPLVSDNYEIAYQILISRYQNERVLVSFYWQSLANASKADSSLMQTRGLLNLFMENTLALNQYNFDLWDFTLFNWLWKKLDPSIRQRFELESAGIEEIPRFETLQKFVADYCRALETSSLTVSSKPTRKSDSYDSSLKKHTFTIQKSNCDICQQNHLLVKCEMFRSKNPKERYSLIRENQLCLNCFSRNHRIANCTSKYRCNICKKKHHTLLHFGSRQTRGKSSSSSSSAGSLAEPSLEQPQQPSHTFNNSIVSSSTQAKVLLATAIVHVRDSRGVIHSIRALIDSGSEVNLISRRWFNKLGLTRSASSVPICGINDCTTTVAKGITQIEVSSRFSSSPTIPVEAVIVPTICSRIPKSPIDLKQFHHLDSLELADPSAGCPRDIDLLLGASLFPYIVRDQRKYGSLGEPVAFSSLFGWLVIGSILNSAETPSSANSFSITVDSSLDSSLDSIVKCFWEVEQIPSYSNPSPEDVKCEELFVQTHRRNDNGRFVVKLPFVATPPPLLGESYSTALRRFVSLENRLLKSPTLHKQYCAVLKDYLDSGHMTPIASYSSRDSPHYYIPHHCVFKPDSSTTKMRVVFDAAAKTSNGLSLNSILLVGEKLQKDIVAVLLSFRKHPVVLTADIKQMYRQILVNEDHRDFQRILWRFSPLEPIMEYRLNTVTFGVSSAPFLALRTLKQLAIDGKNRFPLASEVLTSDIYVDDVVTGTSSTEHAQRLQQELTSLLGEAGFILRKWASNIPEVLSKLPDEDQQPVSFDCGLESNFLKILGLQWNPIIDSFTYKVERLEKDATKRNILSGIARIFDPLGLLAPLTLFAKRLIQHLWSLGLDWDDTPPDIITKAWKQFTSQLPILSTLRIPRLIPGNSRSTYELHGFCDASEAGYAAVVYLRIELQEQVETILIMAKGKVSPLKRLSIPRLELLAAVLLSDLIAFVCHTYNNNPVLSRIVAWSDSRVVLAWIKSSPHRWKTFVNHRVSHIQGLVPPHCWRYVPSSDNPADCASRGLLPEELRDKTIWWNGPTWLLLEPSKWPKMPSDSKSVSGFLDEEKTHSFACTTEANFIDELIEKYSSLNKITYIVAYCLRFIDHTRKQRRRTGHLVNTELHLALMCLVKRVQSIVFKDCIADLTRGRPPPKELRKLAPFLDTDGLLRVGGRLSRAELPFDTKHPVLLPGKHKLTELIVDHYHRSNFHPGLHTMLGLLSQNFWILSAKRAIRSYISRCNRCFKCKPTTMQPYMGNLPATRISQVKPFLWTGVDFGGPFKITLGKHRGAKTTKAYLCLFVCFSTKALHLELASDLSSEVFLAALRRFLARRGPCTRLFSDCGTNFIGANKTLVRLMRNACESEKLEWSFNPPSAPHFGGLWEAGIKSVKSHLVRVMGEQILTFEEFYTLITQIEAMLNSRPLCATSSDPHDPTALTPGHFLLQGPSTVLPDRDLVHLELNRLNRWQLIQRILQSLWNRWHMEYLHTLQQRQKWFKQTDPLSIGSLVLIKDENIPPLRWKLGRVVQLYPGSDGIARVADVKTTNGTCQRPLVKLCLLPSQ